MEQSQKYMEEMQKDIKVQFCARRGEKAFTKYGTGAANVLADKRVVVPAKKSYGALMSRIDVAAEGLPAKLKTPGVPKPICTRARDLSPHRRTPESSVRT